MSLEEFNAAGAVARRAADAAPSLRGLPGYVGIRLEGGKIVVEGSGAELTARIDELNQAAPADFVLAAPAAATTPAATPGAAPAASAPSSPERVAANIDQLFQAYVREVGLAGLQAVAYTDGHFVIRTGGTNTPESGLPAVVDAQLPSTASETPSAAASATPAAVPGKVSPAEFVARYANVQLQKGAAIKTEEDFFGGQGFIIDNSTICSAGFGAFSAAGQPLVLTAGHCAGDGLAKAADIEPASSATAGGSTTPLPRPLLSLGSFGFSQFGGPGNSKAAADGSNVGTDIAVLQSLRQGLGVQPAATTWDNPGSPAPTAVKIVGTVAPLQGQHVCRSGRTSGWKCGTVDSVGVWVIPGPKSLPPNYDNDLRAVHAFDSTSVTSSGGDSGGPWISGNFAVGTHTGAESVDGQQVRAIATTLEDSMSKIPGGVQLQLFLNKPELVAPANSGTVAAGEVITGHVPAAPASDVAPNSKVRITAGTQELEVPVDAAGNWTFRAPLPAGRLAFSAETVNGFSHSGPESFTTTVAPASLPAPGITTPTGAALPALNSIAGTGMPGAAVVLSGDVTGAGAVGLDGRWEIPLAGPAVFGKVAATAILTSPGSADSPSATATFTVIPPAPAGTSIQDGQHLRQDSLPEAISGTGVDGADVAVLIDGVRVAAAQTGGGSGIGGKAVVRSLAPRVLVAGGRWSVPFPAGLALGPHTLSVSQSVDGIASSSAVSSFTIDAPAAIPAAASPSAGVAAASPAAAAVAPAAALPAAPAAMPAASGTPGQPGSSLLLASTGAGGLLPAAGVGAGALLVGGALLVLRRRGRSG